MIKPKNNEKEKKLVASVKREMNQPRLAKSAHREIETQVKLKPRRTAPLKKPAGAANSA